MNKRIPRTSSVNELYIVIKDAGDYVTQGKMMALKEIEVTPGICMDMSEEFVSVGTLYKQDFI